MKPHTRGPLRAAALAIALLVGLLIGGCGGEYSGQGKEFSFRATVSSVKTESDGFGHKSTTITFDLAGKVEGGGASWFSDPKHREVYPDFYDGEGKYQAPGRILDHRGNIKKPSDLDVGQLVFIQGSLRSDINRSGPKSLTDTHLAADRPVYMTVAKLT